MRLGIDLGSSGSAVARVNAQGVPVLFPDAQDSKRFRTPSVVFVGAEGALVGQAAESLAEYEPGAPVARFAKQAAGSPEPALVDHLGRPWPPEAVEALLLRKLKRDVETAADEKVEGVVLGVPAHFNDAQRRATKDAALLAGFASAALVEEPVAAATYYGSSGARRDQTLLVYDFGGGGFSATVLQTSPEGLFALATEGWPRASGRRVDELLTNAIAAEFRRAHRVDVLADPAAVVQLRRIADEVKVALGRPGQGQVRRTLLLAGRTLEFLMTRSQFERVIAPVVDETIECCRRCLAGASLPWSGVDRILLVGGGTLIPLVPRRLALESGKGGDQIVSKQPQEAVVFGAALVAARAAAESRGEAPSKLQRIASHDLGIRVWDKAAGAADVKVLIKRNTPLPAHHTTTLYTTRADQSRMVIEVVQARESAGEAVSLGNFAFGPMSNPGKNYPVEITIGYDVEGIVRVTARDPRTGREMELILEDKDQAQAARLGRLRDLVMSVRVNE